jgi:LAO/AO transport system kinase
VWAAIEQRYATIRASGELAVRRRRQKLRWLWAIIEDRLQQAVRDHRAVRVIRDGLEAGVLAGKIPPEVAARQILAAFGIEDETPGNMKGSTAPRQLDSRSDSAMERIT